MHFSNIIELCLFAPLTRIASGMPLASTEPHLPRSMGLGTVSWPGGLVPGVINAGSAPIDLIIFTLAFQHGLVQLLPDAAGAQVT